MSIGADGFIRGEINLFRRKQTCNVCGFETEEVGYMQSEPVGFTAERGEECSVCKRMRYHEVEYKPLCDKEEQ